MGQREDAQMKPNPAQVKMLRERTGCGLLEAARALRKCDSDIILAAAWLRFDGCAINVKSKPGQSKAEAYDAWVLTQARDWINEQARVCAKQ